MVINRCDDNGRLTVQNAMSGELIYRHRVSKGNATYSASAVSAGAYLYFVSEQGEVTVVETRSDFKTVATNHMNQVVMATPAISGNRLLIRTVRNLYCLKPED